MHVIFWGTIFINAVFQNPDIVDSSFFLFSSSFICFIFFFFVSTIPISHNMFIFPYYCVSTFVSQHTLSRNCFYLCAYNFFLHKRCIPHPKQPIVHNILLFFFFKKIHSFILFPFFPHPRTACRHCVLQPGKLHDQAPVGAKVDAVVRQPARQRQEGHQELGGCIGEGARARVCVCVCVCLSFSLGVARVAFVFYLSFFLSFFLSSSSSRFTCFHLLFNLKANQLFTLSFPPFADLHNRVRRGLLGRLQQRDAARGDCPGCQLPFLLGK